MQHKIPMRTAQVVDHEFAVLGDQAIVPGEFTEPVAKTGASPSSPLPLNHSFLSVKPDNIIVSAIKRAEDGSGIIVRVYNTTNEKVTGMLRFPTRMKEVVPVNMREETLKDSKKQGREGHRNAAEVPFEAHPFRVHTFKLIVPSTYLKRKRTPK
jgi:alpha-mannosidase